MQVSTPRPIIIFYSSHTPYLLSVSLQYSSATTNRISYLSNSVFHKSRKLRGGAKPKPIFPTKGWGGSGQTSYQTEEGEGGVWETQNR